MIGVKITGTEVAAMTMTVKSKLISSQLKKGLKTAAFHMQNEVKESIAGRKAEPTSVDTGRFLNSVDVDLGADDATVFTGVPYAEFLEYGTSRLGARRHFNNSKDRNKAKIQSILTNEIKNI